jgi:transcriptional regulator with XRE-family HTH domain
MRTADTLSVQVADEIRVALVRRRMSARRLAEDIGLSQSAMSARLTGVTPIDLDELERIARALDVPITDLLPREVAEQLNRRLELAADQLTPAPGYATPTLANPPPMYQLAEHATRRPTRLTTRSADSTR